MCISALSPTTNLPWCKSYYYDCARPVAGCWYDDDVFIAGYLRLKGVWRFIYPHYVKDMNAFVYEPGLALIKHPLRNFWSKQCSEKFFATSYDYTQGYWN